MIVNPRVERLKIIRDQPDLQRSKLQSELGLPMKDLKDGLGPSLGLRLSQ